MPTASDGRWPPIYDAHQLASTIEDLLRDGRLAKRFFGARVEPSGVYQGDIVALSSEVPILDRDGAPAVAEMAVEYWLVTGNTCDFSRPTSEVRFTQLAPLVDVIPQGQQWDALRSYQTSRRFYVPPWPNLDQGLHHVADFTQQVAVDKDAFGEAIKVVATMSFEAWVLLHSCLVRFLCRDDGRFDG
jgi:hypothetical protein